MTGMCSIFLLIQLGSLVIVNGYTLDDPEALSNADDVSQEDVMGYLDYLQELRDSNCISRNMQYINSIHIYHVLCLYYYPFSKRFLLSLTDSEFANIPIKIISSIP